MKRLTGKETTRVCHRCKVEKVLSLFTKDKRNPLGVGHDCRQCRSKRELELKATDPGRFRKYSKTATLGKRRRYLAFKSQLIQEAGGRCKECSLVCDTITPPTCFEFHHRDPSKKEFTISTVMNRGTGNWMKRIQAEVKKCDLLCVLCHRKQQFKEDWEGNDVQVESFSKTNR